MQANGFYRILYLPMPFSIVFIEVAENSTDSDGVQVHLSGYYKWKKKKKNHPVSNILKPKEEEKWASNRSTNRCTRQNNFPRAMQQVAPLPFQG